MAVVTQLQFRRGTAAQWTSVNPVLAAGEFGYETDTGKAKIGNGITTWNSLSYALTGAVGTVTSIIAGSGLTGGTITSSGTIAIDSTIVATLTGTQTLTNKTINGSSNTITNVSLTTGVTGTLPVGNGGTGITSLGTGVATFLGTPSSANLAAALTDETGSGAAVFANSPTLTTPNIGVATGTSFNSITGLSSTNPAALGTVAVGTGTTTARADHVHPTTGLGLTSGTLAQFAATTSAQLAGVISDETGSGALVFGTSPTISAGTFSDAIIRQALVTPTFTTNAYTLALTDQGDILLASNGATAGTITIPLNSSVAFPTGTQITIIQTGAGQITIQGAGGVTVASTGATSTAPKLRVQNSSATCIKTNTDTWYVVGDIS